MPQYKFTTILAYDQPKPDMRDPLDKIEWIDKHLKGWELHGHWSQTAIENFVAKRKVVLFSWRHHVI